MSCGFKAKKGSKVKFFFNNGGSSFGHVLFLPSTECNYWIIQTFHEGGIDLIEYINDFNRMCIIEH